MYSDIYIGMCIIAILGGVRCERERAQCLCAWLEQPCILNRKTHTDILFLFTRRAKKERKFKCVGGR